MSAIAITVYEKFMQTASPLAKNPRPCKEEINEAMSGNICRCATYQRIRHVIQRTAGQRD